MTHAMRLTLLLPLASAFVLLGARPAHACSCGPMKTVLDTYEGADVVVVARAVSLKTAPKKESRKPGEGAVKKPEGEPDNGPPGESGGPVEGGEPGGAEAPGAPVGEEDDEAAGYGGVVSTTMVVETVYKGPVKAGDEMVFAQGGGADCIYTFDRDDIGRAYLFYLRRFEDESVWMASTCGRSRPAEYAQDDLLYLNKLDKVRGRTRVSGTVSFDHAAESPGAAGLRVRLVGAGKTFEARTDEHGVYELYDVPAGKYTVEPEIPRGWKVANFWLGYSPSFAGDEEVRAPKKIPIVVGDRRHAGLDILFEIDNAVAGKVYDTLGRPLDGVCLDLLPAAGEAPRHFYKADCTEGGGRFRIEEIPPGSYVLVVNKEGRVTGSRPFGTFYYPNVARREDATVFHVGLGDFVENVQVYIPKMEETVTAEGVLLYSDGRPAAGESVEFRLEKSGEDDGVESRAETDARGRFSVRILKGRRGVLYGEMSAFEGEYENCPKLDDLIRKSGNTIADLRTPAVEVQADNNLYGVELRFPFPRCRKARLE